jgi:hypothetical protein
MRKHRTAVFTGMAALAVAGIGFAAGRDMHVMKVDLPDGSVARIEYKGDVAPKVTLAPASHVMPVSLLDPFGSGPFAPFERIAAEMDRQTEAMFHEVSALQAAPSLHDGKLDLAALGELPPGTIHYQFVSTSNGSDTCNRSVEVTSYGLGQKPRVVSSSSGDCKLKQTPTPVRLDPPAHPSASGLVTADVTAFTDRSRIGTTL